MDLDLRKCRYFIALAEQRHFGRAAEELFIAQPVLSRQVRRLERELNLILIDRTQREFTLTAAGERLLVDARSLLAAADAAVRAVRNAAHVSGAIKIGFVTGGSPSAALRIFEARHPGVSVDICQIEWDAQADALLDGRVDVELVRMPIPTNGLELVRLYAEPRLATLPIDHPLAKEPRLRIAQLADDPVVHLAGNDPQWEAFTTIDPRPDGRRPKRGPAVRTIAEKLEQIAAGHAVAFSPTTTAALYHHPGIVHVPVVDIAPAEVCVAYRNVQPALLVHAFVEAAREAYSSEPAVRAVVA